MISESFIVKREIDLHLPAALRNGRGVFNRYARLWRMEMWLAGLYLLGLLEAMAYRNCVLVSDIEENLEAVAGSGVTFEAKNVNDLKDKLEFLMGNPAVVQDEAESPAAGSRGL